MLVDDHLFLGHMDLAARGWTRALVQRFLGKSCRWMSVHHWLKYIGKATYFAERVMLKEASVDFKAAFAASCARRKLSDSALTEIEVERQRVNALYREWLLQLSPKNVRQRRVIEEVSASLEEARSRGYRTPHN